jgi:hypothetical protein
MIIIMGHCRGRNVTTIAAVVVVIAVVLTVAS